MANVQEEIRSLVDSFTADLTVLVRKAALEALSGALGGAEAPAAKAPVAPAKAAAAAAPAKRGPGRPRKVVAAAPAAAPAAAKAAPAAPAKAAASSKARKKGEKRDPADLALLVERLFDQIKANPGQRVEHINKVLGVPTSELTLPLKKLVAAKRITTKGERRATTYWPKG